VDDTDMLYQFPKDTPLVIAVKLAPKFVDTYIDDSFTAQAL
jgi:hypothetical protein